MNQTVWPRLSFGQKKALRHRFVNTSAGLFQESEIMNQIKPKIHGQPGSMEYLLRSMVARSDGGVVNIAPGIAKRILEELNFPGQRSIDSRRVYGHSHAIAKGDWMESYSLHFAALPDGRIWLVDGQHRLTAIASQEAVVPTTVRIIEVESEKQARTFYAGFDGKGSVRTNVQILDAVCLSEELGLTNRMTRAVYEAAPLLLNRLEPLTGSINIKANPSIYLQSARMGVVVDWAKQAREYDDITRNAGKGLYEKLRKTGPCAVALYTLRHQPARAREFWKGVAENDGLRRGDPRHTLIQDLMTRDAVTGAVRQRVQQSTLAWNAFCEGRDLKIIKCVTGAPLYVWGTPINGKPIK